MLNLKNVIIAAALVALSVILPLAFHAIPNGGILFSPMHIPAFIAGLTIGPVYGILVGILGPFLSSIITGMPVFSYMPQMMIELSGYAFFSALTLKLVKTKSYVLNLYIALIIGMIGGRVLMGTLRALVFARGSYSFNAWLTSYFVSTWPAVILQLIVIPAICISLSKAGLISKGDF